jgi:heme iron utilization protein
MIGAGPRDSRQPADFDPIPEAKSLLRRIRAGALATIDAAGLPLATLTTVATDLDGAPLILTSRLSNHTANLIANPRASILLAERGKGDPLAHPRLSLAGRMQVVERESAAGERARRRFLARHPKAALYIDFPDFLFWRLEIAAAHLNGGFARAWSGGPEHLLIDPAEAAALAGIEAGAVEHMNADHAEANALYATRLLGLPAGRWLCTGIDPEGLDLMAGEETGRLAFPERVIDGGALRRMLKTLADQARALSA